MEVIMFYSVVINVSATHLFPDGGKGLTQASYRLLSTHGSLAPG